MKNKSSLCLFVLFTLFASCEKAYILEEEANTDSSNAQMVVRSSAYVAGSSNETDYVNYPINLYVMDSDGKCVALRQIEKSDVELKLNLEADTYDLYAISGVDNYNLPTVGNASKTSIIEKKEGKGHGDLMTAYNNVVMTKGEENRITLQMQRRVMLVQSISLYNIPDDVTAVQLTISPLYKNIMLNGNYVDGVDSYTFDLQKQETEGIWKMTDPEYLLEAQNEITLKVSLTRESGVTSYTYASSEVFSANYKVNISGNFVDENNINLSGTIKGVDWAGTVSMDFNFNEKNSSETGGTSGNDDEILHGDAPATGTLYNGCYVLRTSSTQNSTTVTLITPTEQNKIKISQSKEEETVLSSIKENTALALSNISVDGISSWRLPSQEEMEYIDNNMEEINSKISALGTDITTFVAKKSGYACGYFFNASDGNVYVYTLGTGGEIDKSPSSERATYKVRGFATVTFTE